MNLSAPSWTIQKTLTWTADYFKKYNFEWPNLEAEILLACALNLKRIQLYAQHEKVLTEEELKKFKAMILRRGKREPTAYITGIQPFMSLDFIVSPAVLIPRPETEKLVEVVIDLERKPATERRGFLSAVDIGTGCGCIAVSLAKYLPDVSVIGIDASEEALKVARENAKKHGVEGRCQFIAGNLFEPLKNVGTALVAVRENRTGINPVPTSKFDIIVSNPPYIPTTEIDKLQPEVRDYEPRAALDGGEDGLFYIRKLIEESPNFLKEGGYLVMEFGFNQGAEVKKLAESRFSEVKIIKDDRGLERVLRAKA